MNNLSEQELCNYLDYLTVLQSKLDKFFKQQEPYIFCKKGCAKCCKNARFPYTEIEFRYLILGSLLLDKETQTKISENVEKLIEEQKNYKGERFYYDCPFLIDDMCSVYPYRGIICRAFGLLTITDDAHSSAPFCYKEGLNFSNVIDPNTDIVSVEMYKKLGIDCEPTAFNVSYKFLTHPDFAKSFQFEFGETKSMLGWFIEYKKQVDTTKT